MRRPFMLEPRQEKPQQGRDMHEHRAAHHGLAGALTQHPLAALYQQLMAANFKAGQPLRSPQAEPAPPRSRLRSTCRTTRWTKTAPLRSPLKCATRTARAAPIISGLSGLSSAGRGGHAHGCPRGVGRPVHGGRSQRLQARLLRSQGRQDLPQVAGQGHRHG
ncbi:MAG: hypothetical protein ACI9WU_001023 [Myxococcota bacterium]|jgi:hypothetical protein